MAHRSDWLHSVRQRFGPDTRVGALSGAIALIFFGSVFSLFVYSVYRPLVNGIVAPRFPDIAYLMGAKGSQVAFGVVIVAYLAATQRWEYVQIRLPTRHDTLWVVLGTAGLDIMAEAAQFALPLLGLSLELLSGTGADVGLGRWPLLWPVVFLGLYLVPALVEEQFVRGIVQGKLRDTFHPASEVVLGAALFSLLHGLYGVARGPEFLAAYLFVLFGQGLAFCLTYQRTRNLFVVALVHAISWADVGFPFFGLL
ncbi:CPBP family intramembrane metalloprotease [Haloarcula sp. S1CR25-12]|uniref:CPBP family intramembrane metalloprotease n=1 Tax=Haloarcula saliterrae TaxID=2950534 RepID=A0ABU2FBZ9_9EURY|nr:CPBP family intramembrane glutamic endopeptidase [Haloarcula sp. S1CR25-12]MDS0259797.1 CPBP family intramembrane metalloprotease [Haloarcula sp. S1CR25-12]